MKKIISKKINPGFLTNIEKDTLDNSDYRRVLFTTHHSQLVVMSIAPGEEIGEETHGLDQFIRVESGSGRVFLDSFESEVSDGSAFVVPAGVKHNLVNTSDNDLKIYSIYSPPNHKQGTIHENKSNENEQVFDGKVDA